MTAQYLIRRTYPVKAGDTIVLHAAAGGVGLILCQWAKHLGATVIGVVSTKEKAELAQAHGAAHTVIGHGNLPAEVKRITGGAMVPVVYDSVGKDTWNASLDCLAPLGLMVSYGNASGPVAPFEIGILGAKGSLYLTRPSLATYTAKRSDLEKVAADLFDVVSKGVVKIAVNQTFPLKDAAAAHIALESRKTTGSTVLPSRIIAELRRRAIGDLFTLGLASRRPWSWDVRKVFSTEEEGEDDGGPRSRIQILRFARSALNSYSVALRRPHLLPPC